VGNNQLSAIQHLQNLVQNIQFLCPRSSFFIVISKADFPNNFSDNFDFRPLFQSSTRRRRRLKQVRRLLKFRHGK
jgi:hypothetical protein